VFRFHLGVFDPPFQGFSCPPIAFAAVCFPADSSGEPLLGPVQAPAGEKDGSTANDFTLAELQQWPQQFRADGAEALSFDVFRFVDLEQLATGELFVNPAVQVFSASLQQALMVQEKYPQDLSNALDVFSVAALLDYDKRCILQLSASRHVALGGQETMTYSYVPLGCQSIPPAQNGWYFQKLLNSTTDALERQRLLEFDANPNMTFLHAQVEMHPPSLQIELVREVQTYTLDSFVADLGQLSNHLTGIKARGLKF
jgi:hypothetical protein